MMLLIQHEDRNHITSRRGVAILQRQGRMVFLQLIAVFSVLLHFLPLKWYNNNNNNYYVHSFVPATTTNTLTAISSLGPRVGMSRYFPVSNHDNPNIVQHASKVYSSINDNAVVANGIGSDGNENTNNQLPAKKGNIIVVGATGYIGKAVVRECLRQNYQTFAFVRNELSPETIQTDMTYQSQSAIPIVCDVTNQTQVLEQMQHVQIITFGSSKTDDSSSSSNSNDRNTITAVVSCLASRSGVKKDAYLIDYQATYNCLQSAVTIQAQHFILLSAFCVQKPLLQFQQGKFCCFCLSTVFILQPSLIILTCKHNQL